MRVAIVNSQTGIVLSVINIETLKGFDPGPDQIALSAEEQTAYHGCHWSKASGFVEPVRPPIGEVELEHIKTTMVAAIDAAAEQQRLLYITGGAGQAMTYSQKAEEARICLSTADPKPEDFPFLAAEVGIRADTLSDVAKVVAAANAQWLKVGAAIEAARLSAKKAISEAGTLDEAEAAAAVTWP